VSELAAATKPSPSTRPIGVTLTYTSVDSAATAAVRWVRRRDFTGDPNQPQHTNSNRRREPMVSDTNLSGPARDRHESDA
jgi:hypothetical protein